MRTVVGDAYAQVVAPAATPIVGSAGSAPAPTSPAGPASADAPKPAGEPQWPTYDGDAPSVVLPPLVASELHPAGLSATTILTSPDRSFVSAVPVLRVDGNGVAIAIVPMAGPLRLGQAGGMVVGPAGSIVAQNPVLTGPAAAAAAAAAAAVAATLPGGIEPPAKTTGGTRREAPDLPQPAPDVPPAPVGGGSTGGGVFASAAGWAASGFGGSLDATLVPALIFGCLLLGGSLFAPAVKRSVAFVSLLERPG